MHWNCQTGKKTKENPLKYEIARSTPLDQNVEGEQQP